MIYNKLFNKIENELNSNKPLKKKEVELKTLFLSFVYILPILILLFSSKLSLNLLLILTLLTLLISIVFYFLILYLNKHTYILSIIYTINQSSFLILFSMYLKEILFKYTYNSYIFITISVTFIFSIFITNLFYLLDIIKIKIFYYKYLIILTFNLLLIILLVFTFTKINNLYIFTYNFLVSIITMLFVTLFTIEYKERIRKDIQQNISIKTEPYLVVLPFTLSLTFILDIIYSITFKKR